MKIISCDNFNRGGSFGDECLVASHIANTDQAEVMCQALNESSSGDRAQCYHVVPDSHVLRKFSPGPMVVKDDQGPATPRDLDRLIDTLVLRICQAHDGPALWKHTRQDPEIFRQAVRSALGRRESATPLEALNTYLHRLQERLLEVAAGRELEALARGAPVPESVHEIRTLVAKEPQH